MGWDSHTLNALSADALWRHGRGLRAGPGRRSAGHRHALNTARRGAGRGGQRRWRRLKSATRAWQRLAKDLDLAMLGADREIRGCRAYPTRQAMDGKGAGRILVARQRPDDSQWSVALARARRNPRPYRRKQARLRTPYKCEGDHPRHVLVGVVGPASLHEGFQCGAAWAQGIHAMPRRMGWCCRPGADHDALAVQRMAHARPAHSPASSPRRWQPANAPRPGCPNARPLAVRAAGAWNSRRNTRGFAASPAAPWMLGQVLQVHHAPVCQRRGPRR